MRSIALFAAAALLGSTAVMAQTEGESPDYGRADPLSEPADLRVPGGTAPAEAAIALTKDDHHFIDNAVQINLAEIEMANIAKEKADLPVGLQTFANLIIKDHTAAQEEMEGIASIYRLNLPDSPSDRQQRKAEMLRGMTGDEFTNAFIKGQIEAHLQAIELFEPEAAQAERATGGGATPIEDYAAKHLPNLRQHLQMAQDLRSELSPTASAQ